MPRVNINDVALELDEDEPDGYQTSYARLGPSIGSKLIGATVYEMPPGQALCPYHYEFDEEWVLVVAGAPSLRTPAGTEVLRAGDLVCFPVGPDGAHRLFNESDAPARIMMLSTKSDVGIAIYPDSGKVGVFPPGDHEHYRFRIADAHVDYYDGEPLP